MHVPQFTRRRGLLCVGAAILVAGCSDAPTSTSDSGLRLPGGESHVGETKSIHTRDRLNFILSDKFAVQPR